MRNIYTPDKRPPEDHEVNSGQILVETAGYVPAEVRIREMIDAGQRLKEAREDAYDFRDGESVPDDYINPLHDRGIDPVELNAAISGMARKRNAPPPKEEEKKEEKEEPPKPEA